MNDYQENKVLTGRLSDSNSCVQYFDNFCLSGAASTAIYPIVRFVLPDLELATVIEEETIGLDDDDDADDNTENFLNNIRRRENQHKTFSHYKPSDQYGKMKTKNIRMKGPEDVMIKDESIRKQVVSDCVLIIINTPWTRGCSRLCERTLALQKKGGKIIFFFMKK